MPQFIQGKQVKSVGRLCHLLEPDGSEVHLRVIFPDGVFQQRQRDLFVPGPSCGSTGSSTIHISAMSL